MPELDAVRVSSDQGATGGYRLAVFRDDRPIPREQRLNGVSAMLVDAGASRAFREPLMSTAQRPSAAIRIAGLSFMLDAGFGVAIPVVLSHLARHGELPMTPWGFRAFAGPFEQLGPERFGALGWTLAGVCALDVVAGVWLWQGRRRGAALGLAMSPLALALAGGFALPFLIAPVPIRAALVLAGRRSLR